MIVIGVHGMVGFAAGLCMHVLVLSLPRRRLALQRWVGWGRGASRGSWGRMAVLVADRSC
jgi:hypothetical protein